MDNQNMMQGQEGYQQMPPNNQNGSAGLAIASMVLGIVALVLSCCFYFISIPCAIIAVILGAVSLKGHKPGKGMAIAGLVTAIISLIPAVIVIISGAALLDMASMSM